MSFLDGDVMRYSASNINHIISIDQSIEYNSRNRCCIATSRATVCYITLMTIQSIYCRAQGKCIFLQFSSRIVEKRKLELALLSCSAFQDLIIRYLFQDEEKQIVIIILLIKKQNRTEKSKFFKNLHRLDQIVVFIYMNKLIDFGFRGPFHYIYQIDNNI